MEKMRRNAKVFGLLVGMLLTGSYAACAQNVLESGRFSWGFNLPQAAEQRAQKGLEVARERVLERESQMPIKIPIMGKVVVFDLACQCFAAYEDGVFAWRNGIPLHGKISSGMRGYETPTGVFSLKWKNKNHWSEKYDAPMPYAAFFTAPGIAVHEGNISRPRQSHGCIRVSAKMAKLLWENFGWDGTRFVVVSHRSKLAGVLDTPTK